MKQKKRTETFFQVSTTARKLDKAVLKNHVLLFNSKTKKYFIGYDNEDNKKLFVCYVERFENDYGERFKPHTFHPDTKFSVTIY